MEVDPIHVSINKQTYKKALLHSVKWASEDVLGVLIGTSEYVIEDAYPIAHTRPSIVTVEVCLEIIQSQLKNGQKIIGLYEARQHPKGSMSALASEILAQIALQNSVNGILMKISQVEVGDADHQLIAKFYSLDENQVFKVRDSDKLQWDVIQESIEQGLHWKIIDFDTHFENPQLDFNNAFV